MKNVFILVLFVFGFFSLQAQELSDKQWSLVSKKTADWCPPCGGYAWDFYHDLIDDQQNEPTLLWALNYSGGLMTPTAKAMSDNFPQNSQPRFFLNNDDMNVLAGNTVEKLAEFKQVLESLSLFPPFASVGSIATFDGVKIDVTSKAKFIVDLEGGDYWLASYLVQDELISSQAGQGNNAKHVNVLLHTFTEGAYFGENISSGSVDANAEFVVESGLDFTGQSTILDYSNGFKVATILWSVVDGKYTPFNINVQSVDGISATSNVFSNVDIKAFHIGTDQININISSDVNMDNVNIQLFDMAGREVSETINTNIISGENQLILSTQNLSLGTYIVSVRSEKGQRSIKVLVR